MLQSKKPQLLTTNGCEFTIVWETEHACAEANLKSDNCKLNESNSDHRVTVDITPLQSRKRNQKRLV